MNLTKYKPYKVLEFFANKISEAYNIQIPKEIKKDRKKIELHIFNIYGEIRKKENNISSMDNLIYGIKMILSDLKVGIREKQFLSVQYEEMKSYIYDNHFKDFNQLPKKVFSYENILFEDILFILLEFVYKSNIHTSKYNFNKLDVRRNFLGRIELTSYNKIQDLKLNRLNFKSLFIDSLEKYNFSIKEIISMSIENKSVAYKTEFINSTFFYYEHLLSKLVEAHNIDTSKVRKKQQLLKIILDEFNIDDRINLKDTMSIIIQRCSESSTEIKNLFLQEKNLFKTKTEIYLKLVNMRNSLHDNGVSNRDEIEIKIGKVKFDKVTKGEHHLSMSMIQVIILQLILIVIFEEVVEMSFEKLKYIEDKWAKAKDNANLTSEKQ